MRQKILVALVGLFFNSCGSWLNNPEEVGKRSSIPNTGDLNGSGADSGKKKTASETEKEKEADTEKGIALYEKNCASCHQSLVQSNVLDNTSEEIKNAIRDKKAMQGLSFLTGVEMDLIASVLKVPKDPAPPKDGNGKPLELDGLILYASNCALCHGHFQDSDIRGRVYEAINFAIDNEPEMKNTRFLNEDQRKALESVLKVDTGGGGQPPIDDTTRGAMLYASYCYESCHGPLESSQKRGRGESAISSAIGSVADMKFLSFLTKDEIDLIVKVLS